jgi:hypothetical protein
MPERMQAKRDALVALYESTNGDGWRRTTGWLGTITPCNRHGVTSNDEGYVIALELFDNELSGDFPDWDQPGRDDLKDLEYLGLASNDVTALSGPTWAVSPPL